MGFKSFIIFGLFATSSAWSVSLKLTEHRDVKIYTDNQEAFYGKLKLIEEAQQTLDATYFIVDDDPTSSRLFLALIDKINAKKTFKARLIVDYFMSQKQMPTLRFLAETYPQNIEIRVFGGPTDEWLKILRDHNIDAQALLRGLMNQDNALLIKSLENGRITLASGKTLLLKAALDELPKAFDGKKSRRGFPTSVAAVLKKYLDANAASATGFWTGLMSFLDRTHHKLMLQDGRCFQMGGRNLSDEYHAGYLDTLIKERKAVEPETSYAFVDLDVKACETVVGAQLASFNVLWAKTKALNYPYVGLEALPAASNLEAIRQQANRAGHYPVFKETELTVKLAKANAQLFENSDITTLYIKALSQLQKGDEATFINAYFYIDNKWDKDSAKSNALNLLYDAFIEAASKRGVTIKIYTNSTETTDLAIVNSFAFTQYQALIDAGIQIYELSPETGESLHVKGAFLRKGAKHSMIVGSYNLDPRSHLVDTNNALLLGGIPSDTSEKVIKNIGKNWAPVDAARLKAIDELLKKEFNFRAALWLVREQI